MNKRKRGLMLIIEYPRSGSAPEAVYLRGVSRYKSTKEPKHLKEAYLHSRPSIPPANGQ